MRVSATATREVWILLHMAPHKGVETPVCPETRVLTAIYKTALFEHRRTSQSGPRVGPAASCFRSSQDGCLSRAAPVPDAEHQRDGNLSLCLVCTVAPCTQTLPAAGVQHFLRSTSAAVRRCFLDAGIRISMSCVYMQCTTLSAGKLLLGALIGTYIIATAVATTNKTRNSPLLCTRPVL